MELIQYWRLIVQNRILIIASVIFGVLVSMIITFATTPTYQSHAELFVSTPASALDISAMQQGSVFLSNA